MDRVRYLALALASLCLPTTAWAGGCGSNGVVYVRPAATGLADGSRWNDAFTHLQPALACAASGSEVWVAAGTYLPHPTDRLVSFVIPSGVAVYGGFAGTETLRSQRDPRTTDGAPNLTTLYGDLGIVGTIDDDTANLVTMDGTGPGTVLDGFLLDSALGNNIDGKGGGVHAHDASPTFENLRIRSADATAAGGGMSLDRSTATLRNVRFEDNLAMGQGGGAIAADNANIIVEGVSFVNNRGGIFGNTGGGAIYVSGTGTLRIRDSQFTMNRCTAALPLGGAILVSGAFGALTTEISNSRFDGNRSNASAGAIAVFGSLTRIVNSHFTRNQSATTGAAIAVGVDSDVTVIGGVFNANTGQSIIDHRTGAFSGLLSIRNSTITGNAGALVNGLNPPFHSSILHNNPAGLGTAMTFTDSVVQFGCPMGASCTNVIDADPRFLDADGPNDIPGDDDDDLRIAANSPARDVADTSALPPDSTDVDRDSDTAEPLPLDADSAPRVINGILDLGAFEFQSIVFADGFE